MKCRFQEFAKPLSQSETYNVDFKPTVEHGFLRKDGLKKSTIYSLQTIANRNLHDGVALLISIYI